jgi:hypothetical protein
MGPYRFQFRFGRGFFNLAVLFLSFQALDLSAQTVKLAWDPNPPSDNVAYYTVYVGTASGNYYTNFNAGNLTNYTVSGLQPSTKYYFSLTATSSADLESPFSAEVSTTLGTRNVEIRLTYTITNISQYQIQGKVSPGKTYLVQATEDLKTWHDVVSGLTGGQGQFSYTTNNFRGIPFRFYRAVQQ